MNRRFLARVLFVLALASCDAGEAAPPSSTAPVIAPASTTVAPTTTAEATTTTTSVTTTAPEVDIPVGPGTIDVILEGEGPVRTYRLHVPEGLDGPAPLVVDLHGFTSNPENHDSLSGWTDLADLEGVVVAQPAALGDLPAWETGPGTPGAAQDVAFIREVVADAAGKVAIDPLRVYASGFSNGGGLAHRLACDASDVFAAIGTVAGSYLEIAQCAAARPVPVVSFHGTADLIVPFTGLSDVLPDVTAWAQGWADRNGCGPVPVSEQIAADVLRNSWGTCEGDAAVVLHVIEGGRHTWPGSRSPGLFSATDTIDATAVMWAFFDDHPFA
jgi:polyhydroxybutyrate depolymerase